MVEKVLYVVTLRGFQHLRSVKWTNPAVSTQTLSLKEHQILQQKRERERERERERDFFGYFHCHVVMAGGERMFIRQRECPFDPVWS